MGITEFEREFTNTNRLRFYLLTRKGRIIGFVVQHENLVYNFLKNNYF